MQGDTRTKRMGEEGRELGRNRVEDEGERKKN